MIILENNNNHENKTNNDDKNDKNGNEMEWLSDDITTNTHLQVSPPQSSSTSLF